MNSNALAATSCMEANSFQLCCKYIADRSQGLTLKSLFRNFQLHSRFWAQLQSYFVELYLHHPLFTLLFFFASTRKEAVPHNGS